MAQALDFDDLLAPPRPPRPVPPAVLSPYLPPPKPRLKGLSASLAKALDERRLFVLLPFAMIVGLVTAAGLPFEPDPVTMGIGAVAIALGLALSLKSLPRLRLATLAAAFWVGLCLLTVHGALLGTAMLGRPVYGAYQARVDEILSETPTEKRVVLSAITPTGTDPRHHRPSGPRADQGRPRPVARRRHLRPIPLCAGPGPGLSGRF